VNWIESISQAISYIEENITEELTVEDIAKRVHISPFYFQKGFSMLCGLTVSDYIRYRRLAIAGSELLATDNKIIDIALKYGYESPDGFTKAFTRFHGSTPSAVRKDGSGIKSFSPLSVKFKLEASKEIPEGFTTKVIPKFTWAAFTCKGPMPQVMQDVNKKIYSEWLPNCKDYEIAAGYCIEMYDNPAKFAKGVQDENYYSEMWIPVKKK